jgi:hypothetical protein
MGLQRIPKKEKMMDLEPKINCRIKVQFGNEMHWVDGFIKSKNADGTVWIRVPKADQIYLCDELEVYVNLADVRKFNDYHKL